MPEMMKTVLIGIFIPFIGTLLGAASVFLMRGAVNPRVQRMLSGFAAGVMIAASVWSLLIPSIEISEQHGGAAWVPAAVGFTAGIAFLLVIDCIIPHLHINAKAPEGISAKLKSSTMLVLAVTLHNLPEGMAVGVVFAGILSGDTAISAAGAFVLAAGIALQNVPEGAIISMPLLGEGVGKKRAFFYGVMSGIVEPVGAGLTIALLGLVQPVLPYILAFAAGAMIYVVVEELIPQSQSDEHSNVGTVGTALGFVLMMIMDVALG